MKNVTILIMTIAATGAVLVHGQPAFDEEPPPASSGREQRDGPRHGFRMAPRGHEPAAPLHRLMAELRETNPAEFDRLQSLRMTDPSAFRAETRILLQQAAMERLQQVRPGVYDALAGLSDDDRAWLLERMGGRMAAPPPGPPGEPEAPPPRENRHKARSLLQAYHGTTDEGERDAIRTELRALLAREYDERLAMRRDQLRDMEAKLEHIRTSIEMGEQEKDAFIEQKLSAWLERSPGRGPRPSKD